MSRCQRRATALTDNLPAIISQFDAEHRCILANEQFRHFCGADPASVIGKTPREFRGEGVYTQIEEHLEAVLKGEARQFEVVTTIQGRECWLQQSLIPDVVCTGALSRHL